MTGLNRAGSDNLGVWAPHLGGALSQEGTEPLKFCPVVWYELGSAGYGIL